MSDRPSRRQVVKGGIALMGAPLLNLAARAERTPPPMEPMPFSLKYAPHFGMFSNHAGDDKIAQLQFAADEGFKAWECNEMKSFPVDEQERIAKKMDQLGMTMGVFVVNLGTAWSATLTTGKQDSLDKFLDECRTSVDVAKRVNAKWMTVVPGTCAHWLEMGYQTANVVEALRRGAEIFEPHGLVMVLEPLNYRDHPELFLTKVAQGFQICRAVDSPSCKLLMDLYHQQIEEGNLIPNMDLAWSEIAYFQIGDNPGRNEPTTGEVNYKNVFGHIRAKGFTGVMGMEHGIAQAGKEGERALIQAYRSCDS
ncbi:MAG: TIM barrel protein [Fimbriimonadaceae bacterium]|nr:TIM barrel protein [Fimbriimonadaceae bacterium]QYK56148.1 MAG: TIM barrel protein [Fimbriimonadaceae bacterium]